MKICCEIKLETELNYPNDELRGEILINPLKNVVATKLLLQITGTAECYCWEKQSQIKLVNIFQKGRYVKSVQEFYNHTITLENDAEIIWMKNEKYAYPFACVLPPDLPPTWRGSLGHITYTATVKVRNKEEQFSTFETKLSIGAKLDLSLESHLAKDVHRSARAHFRVGLLKFEQVKVTLWLPTSGVALGQSLPMLCTIVNKTNVRFDNIDFALEKSEITGKGRTGAAAAPGAAAASASSSVARKKTTIRKTVVCRVTKSVDIARGKFEFYCALKVPEDIAPTIARDDVTVCRLVYDVCASLVGSYKQLSTIKGVVINTPAIPLTIGTKPINDWHSETVTQEVLKEMYDSSNPSAKDIIQLYDCIQCENSNGDSTICNIERHHWHKGVPQ